MLHAYPLSMDHARLTLAGCSCPDFLVIAVLAQNQRTLALASKLPYEYYLLREFKNILVFHLISFPEIKSEA